MRALFHFLFILSVAMLPLTSFAARAGTAADLTSSAAVEVEQGPLPSSGPRAPVQVHRHCTHWAAEAGTCLAIAQSMPTQFPVHRFGPDAFGSKMAGPEASIPPPKA